MNLLLDSHVLLWYDVSTKLTPQARDALRSAPRVCVSVATIWELTLKQTVGKLSPSFRARETATRNRFELLPITAEHAELAGSLPLHHRDPFDRMLVAQAMLERLTLVTHDATLSRYGVAILQVGLDSAR